MNASPTSSRKQSGSRPRALGLSLCAGLALGSATARAQESGSADASAQVALDAGAKATSAKATQTAARRLGAAQNSVSGLTGGIHAVDAGSGPAGSFRVSLYGHYFRKDDFIAAGDSYRRTGGLLSLSVTPVEHLEVAATLEASLYNNREEQPRYYEPVGDATFFVKGYASPLPWLTLGGDVSLLLRRDLDHLGYQGNATSAGLRANATFDLRELAQPLPLRVRTNVRYLFDNSARLVRGIENARYAALDAPRPRLDESRNLRSPSERFAYGVQRLDSVSVNVGLEVPLDVGRNVHLSPLVEWQITLPSNRQGYDCLIEPGVDGCFDTEGFAARPSTLSMGLRIEPAVRGLSLLLAADVATSGHKTFVREFAPNAPYDLWIGASYAYDARAPEPLVQRVEVPVEVQVPLMLGRILGSVLDADSEAPVARAVVHFKGTEYSDVLTDESGRFASVPLPPGSHELVVSAPGYAEAPCLAALPDSYDDASVRCVIKALPPMGQLRGRVLGTGGETVPGARVKVEGPVNLNLEADLQGNFAYGELPQGQYRVQAEAEGYLSTVIPLDVVARKEAAPTLTLVKKPEKSAVALEDKRITIHQQVQFESNSAAIRPQSHALLAEVADVLIRHPQLVRVEIQGHTDDRGTKARNQALSQERAEAVRAYLIRAGVEPERLVAVGYGSSRPLMPNITPTAREKNRRIEFAILEVRTTP
jgi:OOP family OmpA-OmpF porin